MKKLNPDVKQYIISVLEDYVDNSVNLINDIVENDDYSSESLINRLIKMNDIKRLIKFVEQDL